MKSPKICIQFPGDWNASSNTKSFQIETHTKNSPQESNDSAFYMLRPNAGVEIRLGQRV